DLSIALSSGAALAQAASGIVLTANRIEELGTARFVARRMQRILRQNLSWAVVYNVAAVPLAACGLVPPWLAAVGMSASSLIVVLNSLRIRAGSGRRTDSDSRAHVAADLAHA